MGDCREECSEVNDGAEALCADSYGVKAFFKLNNEGHGALCDQSDGTVVLCEEDDGIGPGWVSPRISFSQDLTLGGPEGTEALVTCTGSSRVSPEKRKWQEAGEEEPGDGYSSEFEFLNDGVIYGGFTHQERDMMLSAEELFSEGKLLPLHIQQTMSSSSSSDLWMPTRSKPTLQEALPVSQENLEKPMARHLSLDLPKPSSSSFACDLAPVVSLSVDNSPCTSPPRSTTATSSAFPSAVSHKSSSKYSFRIKDFFKPKMASSVNAQLTRDNSTTSTCRIPIPPRSFWPFSRSNSAGESKTMTPPPTLPPRSNSAGESNTSRASTDALKSSSKAESCDALRTSHSQDSMVSPSCKESTLCASAFSAVRCDGHVDAVSSNQTAATLRQIDGDSTSNTTSTPPQDPRRSNSRRASGSPGRISRRKYMYTTANFLRGSPGRRGGMTSFGKATAGRIVLKNLERCSAERKLCRESSGRRGSYPVAVRVTPVLNVAVYRGTSGMFGLRSLFSSKKEKGKEKLPEGAINNWRAGA